MSYYAAANFASFDPDDGDFTPPPPPVVVLPRWAEPVPPRPSQRSLPGRAPVGRCRLTLWIPN